jgi:hypothetical protein
MTAERRPPTARWRRFWWFCVVFGILTLVWTGLILLDRNSGLGPIGVMQVGINVVTGLLLIVQGWFQLRADRQR